MTSKELQTKLAAFLAKYLGQSKGYPTDSQFKGECLSIVKLYIKEVFGIDAPASGSGSAYGYWSNFPSPLDTIFEKIENTPTLIPEKGWIAIWKPWATNQYGHISIVDDGSTLTKLVNDAQNWTSRIFQREENNYNNVIGYLKPKLDNSTETDNNGNMNQDETNALNAIKTFKDTSKDGIEKGNYEGAANAAVGAYREVSGLKSTISSNKTTIDTLTTAKSDLEKKIDQLSSDSQTTVRNNLQQICIDLAKLTNDQENTDEKIRKIQDIQKLTDLWQTLKENAKNYFDKIEDAKNTNYTNYRNKLNEFNALKQIVNSLASLFSMIIIKFRKGSVDEYITTEILKITNNNG